VYGNLVRFDDTRADIAASDLAAIVKRLSHRTYITQEVIFGGGEPIQPSEYASFGASRD